MDRTEFDQYFMQMADVVKQRSTCARAQRQVGAIITIDNRVIATGYNGAVRGAEHCIDIGCARDGIPSGQCIELCRAVHAEMNALCQAARYGTAVEGATVYVTLQPCKVCLQAMYQAGVARVVYREPYPGGIDGSDFHGMLIERL